MTDEDTRTFRRLRETERAAFQRFVDYAFSPEEGPTTEDGADDEDDPEDRQGTRYGVFADGDLASVCVHYDFEARLHDAWVPMAGLAAVATPPENRHRGHVRFSIAESLDRWRGEYRLAALWPFSRPYYGQFGWATANRNVAYSCPPEALSAARNERHGRFRSVATDEWELLQPVHEAHGADRNLTLRRDGPWWRDRVFSSLGSDDRHVYAYERDGAVRGYLVYTFESTGDGLNDRTLHVTDLAYADHDTLRQLLGFLGDHDSQAESVSVTLEPDAPLMDLVPEPADLDATLHGGPMVRIVDVADVLSALTYSEGASVDCTVAVTDDTAPWNDGVFEVRVADGESDWTPLDGTGSAGTTAKSQADATVDIGTLSQLVVGYHDVETARGVGGLSVTDDTAAEALAACVPERSAYLRTYF